MAYSKVFEPHAVVDGLVRSDLGKIANARASGERGVREVKGVRLILMSG
jgi:hypothetical protein